MKLRSLTFVSGVLLFLVAFHLGQRRVHAQNEAPVAYSVPSSYGHCVGYLNHKGGDGLIFEATDGTIHVVNLDSGKAITIPRQ